jgi:hypothetical protein
MLRLRERHRSVNHLRCTAGISSPPCNRSGTSLLIENAAALDLDLRICGNVVGHTPIVANTEAIDKLTSRFCCALRRHLMDGYRLVLGESRRRRDGDHVIVKAVKETYQGQQHPATRAR